MSGPGTYLNAGAKTKKPYVRVCAGPQRDRYVHQLVMEGMLGRELKAWEQVEHADGDGTNNRWTNLVLTTDESHPALTSERLRREKGEPPVVELEAEFEVLGAECLTCQRKVHPAERAVVEEFIWAHARPLCELRYFVRTLKPEQLFGRELTLHFVRRPS